MDARLEHIVCRLVEATKAREWSTGFRMWSSALVIWHGAGYPMRRDLRIRLIFMYYDIIFIPGMDRRFIEDRCNDLISLLNDRNLNIHDIRIPWRPLYDALYNQLFPHPGKLQRYATNLAPVYLNLAEMAQRFFHPGEVDEMLATIMPPFDPAMDNILATQLFMVHFLPISHCQKWLPLMFRMWYGINSGLWDDQASDLLGQLAIAHVDPTRSDPKLIDRIPRGRTNTPEEQARNPSMRRALRAHRQRVLDYEGQVIEDADGLNYWVDPALLPPEEEDADPEWKGIRKDVGIFTDAEFEFIMSKCLRSLKILFVLSMLRSMGLFRPDGSRLSLSLSLYLLLTTDVPVGGSVATQNSMSVTAADARASKKIIDSKKPIDRTQSLAEAIVYSMAEDSPVAPFGTSTAVPTRSGTPAEGQSTSNHSADPVARLKNGFTSMSRSGSSDSLAAAGERIEATRKYLAGSKALDHLAHLMTSCETFFHPSNSGTWTSFLTVFLAHLTNNFLTRWKAEEEPTCKTPMEWRLTPELKRSFVLTLRPAALTSMFVKEMDSAQPAISTLRRLAVLEPDLILPALMERAVPSLQGLEETQRTLSVTYAVASLAPPIAARRFWRFGGLYLADLFTLLLPGIDLNDPTKTGLTCVAICNMVDFIRISDISEVDEATAKAVKPGARAMRSTPFVTTEDDPNDPVSKEFIDLTPDDVESQLRLSTAAFREWVPEFLGRVLLLFANLPEEGGKTGRAGGKIELLTLQSVLHTCGAIFQALDDKLFDSSLDQIVEYATTTTRANAVDAVGELVRNLASVNAKKTFEKLFPICRQRILAELKAGASATRTNSTSIPRPSDAPLHWWMSILYGLLIPGRLYFDEYQADYMDLIRTMLQSTYSERGWRWTGKVVGKTLSCFTALYLEEMHMLNKPDRESDDFKLNHTLWWGKMYRQAEALPQWKMPTDANVAMALDIVGIADEAVTTLNGLLDSRTGDHVWINDFCRAMSLVDEVIIGSYALIQEAPDKKLSDVKASDVAPHYPEELLDIPKALKAGFLLTDPADPRYQRVMQFRQRAGEMLARAGNALKTAGDSDNSVDCVKILLNAIGSFLLAYGMRSKKYTSSNAAFETLQMSKRLYENQRKQHRSVILGALQVHHSNRLMISSYYRDRTNLDDQLIQTMHEFCLSPFVRIRRRAQTHFDSISKTYRGTFMLSLRSLFEAVQPGSDPDRMKGALYVLRYNVAGIVRMTRDWVGLPELIDSLLNAHHESKPSIQALVSKTIDETLSRIKEPTTFFYDVGLEAVDKAADEVAACISRKPDPKAIEAVRTCVLNQITYVNSQYDLIVERLQAKAADESLNWRYKQAAARFLYVMLRRDRPTDVRVVEFFLKMISDPHPRIRDYGFSGLTRILFQATLRSFCQGDLRRLMVQEPVDPLASELDLTKMDKDFPKQYIAAFREEPKEDSVLQDRTDTGWLCWGKTMAVARFTKWDEQIFNLEPACQPAMDLIIQTVSDPAWWKRLSDYWSLEENRNYPSATRIDLILALCQVVGRPVFDQIQPIVNNMLADMAEKKVYDRHVTRAMYELLGGLLRGTPEWPGKDRKDFWDWFAPLLPELFRNLRQDTVKCWDITLEYTLHEQDPRRFKPLVDFMVSTALSAEFQGGSAFDLLRRVQLARSILRCLRWRGSAWSPDFQELYFNSLDCPYAEVRALIGSVINGLDQLEWNASFPSAKVLVDTVLKDTNHEVDIMGVMHPPFEARLKETIANLQELRKVRPHGPTAAMSSHDNTALTIMHWLTIDVADVHAVAAFPYLIPLLPELFKVRDMNDNIELQSTAGRLLAWVPAITPPFPLVEPLIQQLITILQDSTSWRTKMYCLPVLSLCYFRNQSMLSELMKAKCLDVVSNCLKDQNQEVREMASMTLAGFMRTSELSMVVVIKDRFVRKIESIKLPRRNTQQGTVNTAYQTKLVELHAAVLGCVAVVEAFPFTVPKFLPPLIADTLAPRVSEPMPVSGSIRSCIASFKKTHEKYQERMTEDQVASMNYAQAGNSYYA